MAIAPSGRIQWIGRGAASCLKKYFPPPAKERSLPDGLASWIKRQPEEAGCWKKNGSQLVVQLVDQSRKGTKIFLLEERTGNGHQLTPSEELVLRWVKLGKTNEQVAQILDIRISTVKKHLERTFVKLGVENRTAAASYVDGPN